MPVPISDLRRQDQRVILPTRVFKLPNDQVFFIIFTPVTGTDLSDHSFERRSDCKSILDITFNSPVGTEQDLNRIFTSGTCAIWSEDHDQNVKEGWVELRLNPQDALFSTMSDQLILQNGGTCNRANVVAPRCIFSMHFCNPIAPGFHAWAGSATDRALQSIPGLTNLSEGQIGLLVKNEEVKHETVHKVQTRTPPRSSHPNNFGEYLYAPIHVFGS